MDKSCQKRLFEAEKRNAEHSGSNLDAPRWKKQMLERGAYSCFFSSSVIKASSSSASSGLSMMTCLAASRP